jgi:hypothetical protein
MTATPARGPGYRRVVDPRTNHLEDAMTELSRAAVPGARS